MMTGGGVEAIEVRIAGVEGDLLWDETQQNGPVMVLETRLEH